MYRYDFSEFTREDVNAHGLYGYKYLDHYWTEAGRYAYFIQIDEQYAGFVLIRTEIEGEFHSGIHSIAEFFVLKKYRRMGIGRQVAVQAFDQYPGTWEVCQEPENKPSILFWDRIVGEYTHNQFEVRMGSKQRVLIFQSPAARI
ncbi:MAG: GNAT family N-acetyltransferase [Bacteroidota bacterium]